MTDEAIPDVEKKYWLDEPKNVNKIVYTLYGICVGLVCLDFFYHKHPHFDFESWWGFFGFYGLVGSVSLVMVSKAMRIVLMRKEDYYDE